VYTTINIFQIALIESCPMVYIRANTCVALDGSIEANIWSVGCRPRWSGEHCSATPTSYIECHGEYSHTQLRISEFLIKLLSEV